MSSLHQKGKDTMNVKILLILSAFFLCLPVACKQDIPKTTADIQPVEHIYAVKDSSSLHVFVFTPTDTGKEKHPAIALIHGGGWAIGEPSWTFWQARHFAELGMVAVAAQYRLSDQKNITPLEAMADTRDVILWMRANADSLQIDPDKIAAYGWSAGGHLAASTAVFPDTACSITSIPNALVLVSPAVTLAKDNWFKQMLLNRAEVASLSPDQHVRAGLPPTIILQGRTDTVTPLSEVQKFADNLAACGNRCELIVYNGVGHMFTPSSIPDYNQPQPDPAIQADANTKIDLFLKDLGYIK